MPNLVHRVRFRFPQWRFGNSKPKPSNPNIMQKIPILRLQSTARFSAKHVLIMSLLTLAVFAVAPAVHGQGSYTIYFHSYPSCVYNGQTIDCPSGPYALCGGIGSDALIWALNVHLSHAPSQYTYFAYDVYVNGGLNCQAGWEVDTSGVVHNAYVGNGNVQQQYYPWNTWEFRTPQSSDSSQVSGMSYVLPTLYQGTLCDGQQGTAFNGYADVYCLGATAGGSNYYKANDKKQGGNQCQSSVGGSFPKAPPMALYSAHAMLASLNIEDTPIRYSPPRGPAVNFTVTYNQRQTQQPQTFSYSNLGPKWTFNWLSYVVDDPNNALANATVYVPGGGTEAYSGFDSGSQSYLPDAQSHAVLVRTSSTSYEKRFLDGSKQVFNLTDGATSYPRKIFMTQWVDPAGNAVTLSFDSSFRITTITDALGQITSLSYELSGDPLKITKVTEPFPTSRYATFAYDANGRLTTITDEIGIQSVFTYTTDGTNFITSLQTPYGTSTFATDSNSNTNHWIEMTDPLGSKERVEYLDNAPGINASDSVAPAGMTNSGLDVANTFYWDKKAVAMYPPVNGVYDYTKARITHWTYNPNGAASGIPASEKAPLENRVWYAYAGQSDTNHPGPSANPSQVARVLDDGTTQLWQYQYNSIGNLTQSTDPIGRVMSYAYDPANNIDLLTVRQTTGSNNDLLRTFTYNSQREPLTDKDAAGQTTTYTYNTYGQMLTRTNAKNEITTLAYGGTVPDGYLASITSPLFNGSSAVTTFTYDSANRVRTVTDSDAYTVTTDYDNLDRQTQVTYPDGTNQQFQYSQDFGQGLTTILDLTKSKDRRGLWTTRHYNANRQIDSITDPLSRTTQYGWCTCGAMTSITDPKNQTTTFNRDLQSRVTSKIFADNTSISYAYENTTSRLKSMTDALNQTTNYQYFADDSLKQVSYTNAVSATPTVSFTYGTNYKRVLTMLDGTGTTTYAYNPIAVPPALGAGQLASIDSPIANDTITFSYDQLGRVTNRSINGTANSATWTFDSLGRASSVANKLGTFNYAYVNVTNRLSSLTYPGGSSAVYSYFPNSQDKRLQEIKNQTSSNALISQFDYTYDAEGQILTWKKNYSGLSPAPQRFDLGYDNADQLLTAPLKNDSTNALIKQYTYGYDVASSRTSELVGTTTTTSTPNNVNEIVSQSGGTNRTLTYNTNGSLINDGSSRTFEWDAANRLVAINYTGTRNRSEFTYDGLSRCVKIVEKTGTKINSTRKFVWCGMEKCEFRDANDAVTLFVYPQGQFSGTTAYFYSRDHLGSIREMFKSNGTVVARYDYDPYGRSTAVVNTTLPDFNFSGLYRHSASNLDFATYRAYDPDLGRWLSRDPLAGAEHRQGTNLYSYVRNNSPRLVDPFGLETDEELDREAEDEFVRETFEPVSPYGEIRADPFSEGNAATRELINEFGQWLRGLYRSLFPEGGQDAPTSCPVQIPENYEVSPTTTGGGAILGPPGQDPFNDAGTYRFMPPGYDPLYPEGYLRQYNPYGQPINPTTGRPGSNAETHIPLGL
jgi:RHS repeat-associated protein